MKGGALTSCEVAQPPLARPQAYVRVDMHAMRAAAHALCPRKGASSAAARPAAPRAAWRRGSARPRPRRYQKRGYVFGYISHFEGMETGNIVARVVEGRVNKVQVVPVDDEGIPRVNAGEIKPDIILRELPFKARRPALALRRPPPGSLR